MLVLWNGLFALKGSEKPIIERISQAMEKTVKNPAVIKRIKDSGNEYEYIPGERFAQEIEKEHENIVSLIKKANLTFK